MAVNRQAVAAAKAVKIRLSQHIDATSRTMMGAWAEGWAAVADEWVAVADELVALAQAGEWPNRKLIDKARRVKPALQHTARELDRLVEQSGSMMTSDLSELLGMVDEWERSVVAPQLPRGQLGTLRWDRINPQALNRIVERSTEQFFALAKPIRDTQLQAIRQAMIRGVALGENSGDVADRLLIQLRNQFDGGAYRVEVITRTEMLDAYRFSSLEARKQGAAVLGGWEWLCDHSERTCAACLAMDGRRFPIDQPGPWDHVSGRCTAIPVTKSWRELGIDLDEPNIPERPLGRDYFDQLPQATQARIMGKERLARLRAGDVGWDDLTVLTPHTGWRPAWGLQPVKNLPG